MTTKADYTEEEWNELIKAPITAGVLVITADLHVTSMMGEMKGMMKGMMKQPVPEGGTGAGRCAYRRYQGQKSENKEKMEQPDIKGKDPEQVMSEMLGAVERCLLRFLTRSAVRMKRLDSSSGSWVLPKQRPKRAVKVDSWALALCV